jgi:hypothetical protein
MTNAASKQTFDLQTLAQIGLKAPTGTDDPDLQMTLLQQVISALSMTGSDGEVETRARAALAALAGLKPADTQEGLLAAHMVAVHDAAMVCLQQAASCPSPEVRELSHRQALGLLGMYLRQMEALDRHRGRGASTVNVGSLNVQALVGFVEAPTRRPRKRRLPPPAPALEHQPVTPLRVDRPEAAAVSDERIKRMPGDAGQRKRGVRRG